MIKQTKFPRMPFQFFQKLNTCNPTMKNPIIWTIWRVQSPESYRFPKYSSVVFTNFFTIFLNVTKSLFYYRLHPTFEPVT